MPVGNAAVTRQVAAVSALNLVEQFGGSKEPIEDAVVPCAFTGVMLAGSKEAAAKHGLDMLTRDKLIVGPDGGGYQLPNLIPVSPAANQSRGDRPPPDWTKPPPPWGDPATNTRTVISANTDKVAAEFHRRRNQILAKKGRTLGEHLEKYPNGLPEDWDAAGFTPAGSEQGQAELPLSDRGRVDRAAVNEVHRPVPAVPHRKGSRDGFSLDQLVDVIVRRVGPADRVDAVSDHRNLIPNRCASR